MTETPEQQTVEPLAPGDTKTFTFTPSTPTIWTGEAKCKHAAVRNATYLIAPGVPPLNHAQMAHSVLRQHDQIVGCNCPYDPFKLNVTVTFQPANAVQPGQQRYIPQQNATIAPPAKNFFFGPALTCGKTGAYQIVAKIALSRSISQGAAGNGVLLVSAVPTVTVPMVDQSMLATANIDAIVNLTANQSVALGYENTSANVQDVNTTTLTINEVWVP